MLAAQADNAPVLISGGNGTGKGAIACWLHFNGPRSTKPLIVTNHSSPLCNDLLRAQGGSIIINEIGGYPFTEQKILLQLLITRSIPHPENHHLKMLMNVRVMATTSQALECRAQGGLFNLDLLEKLNVFRLEMPPLSKRHDEFNDIASGILHEITRELHKEHIRKISEPAFEKLRDYEWPGNLRELRNVLRIAVISCTEDQLEKNDLPNFGQDRINFRATREQFEKIYILELLKTFNWQIDETCRMTRMDRTALLGKIKQYGISLEEVSASNRL